MATRPNIFVKLSEVYHPRSDGVIVRDYGFLRERLDSLFEASGEDRVLFDPSSYGVATIRSR